MFNLPQNAKIAFVLAICGFACSMGLRVLDPVVPDLASNYQVSIRAASLTASIFPLAYGFGQLIMGPLADKLGCYKMLTIAMLLVAGFSSLALIPYSHTALLISRFGAGLFASAIVSSSVTLLSQLYDSNKRAIIIAHFMMAAITAQLFGAVLMSHLAPHFFIMYLLLATCPLIGLALLYPFRHEAILNKTSHGTLFTHLINILKQTHLPLLALLGFLEGMLVFGPIPYISVKLAEHSTTSTTTMAGYAIGCFALGGLVFALTSHIIIKLLKYNQVTVGIGCLTICWLIVTNTTSNWVILLVMLGVGMSFYTLHNRLQVSASNCYPPARTSGMSLFMFAFFSGQGLGSILFGIIMIKQGINHTFLLFAIFSLIVAIFSWLVRYKISEHN